MSRPSMNQTQGERFPVSLLTGFLGSGKTTVLNHLLRHPGMAKTVVVVNEFGEVGLDHELIESSSEEMILLQSGCLCCSIRRDLIETLRGLFLRQVHGEMPPFDRVVIETTGLADPAPILHTLMRDPLISERFRLDGVITTVDAATGWTTLDRQIESVKQAAVADRLLLTKTDLADPAAIDRLQRRLRALNPAAPIIPVAHGEVEPARLFDAGLYNPKTKSLDVQRWLQAEAYLNREAEHDHAHDHGHHDHRNDDHDHDHGPAAEETGHAHHAHHDHVHDVNRHDEHIKAFCLVLDEPVNGDAFDRWLEALLLLKGPDILRVKGIVNVIGLPGPFVIHGVQHIFHPPVMMKKWPTADRRTRIVFITRDVDEAMLRDTWKLFSAKDEEELQAAIALNKRNAEALAKRQSPETADVAG
jgi:G3E family GTPase